MILTLAIPNRNGARYLESTLRSLDSNRPCVRWWLQDGRSEDDSLRLAHAHAGPNDRVCSEPDTGQANALNRAFSAMGGDVIGFINSDDLLAPGAAAAVAEFFSRHPDVDLVYGEISWIDGRGAITGHHKGRIDSAAEILDVYRVWWAGRQWVQPEVFFRRSLWERVGKFDERYELAFDYDFWVRCMLAGARVARIPRVLAHFRLHPQQKSRAAAAAAAEIRDIVVRHVCRADLPRSLGRRLLAQVDYDNYRLGEGKYRAGKPNFAWYLMTHPRAWMLADVRNRLGVSARKRLQ